MFKRIQLQTDSEDVYYHFGGAVIASMLHSRYEKLKQHSGDDKQLSEETIILQKFSQIKSKRRNTFQAV